MMKIFNEQNKEEFKDPLIDFGKDDKIHSMLFGRLTLEQKKAVFTNHESSLLIVAGPGTGKTATLTSRIVRFLLSGYSPILALTFTRKAANELKGRVSIVYRSSSKIIYSKSKQIKNELRNENGLSDFVPTPEIFIGTIHSFCWKLLKEYGSFIGLPKDISIIDKELAVKLLKSCLSENSSKVTTQLSNYSSLIFDPVNFDEIERDDFDNDNICDQTHDIKAEDEQCKNLCNLKKETDIDQTTKNNEFEKVFKIIKLMKIKKFLNNSECKIDDVNGNHELLKIYNLYTKKMVTHKPYLVDYTDLITLTLNLLGNNINIREKIQDSYPYIFCDEFQDTSKLQFKILELLTKHIINRKRKFEAEKFTSDQNLRRGGITVVGDDDQAIYSWRGVETGVFSQFSSMFKNKINLIYLSTNFRSTKSIIQVSNNLVKKNKLRISKLLISNNDIGVEPVVYYFPKQIDEMQWIASTILLLKMKFNYSWSEFAILARTNDTLFYIEKLLTDKKFLINCLEMLQDNENIKNERGWLKMISNDLLDVDIDQLSQYKSAEINFPIENTSRNNPKFASDLLYRAEILDILSYCRLIIDETADDCFLRVCNRPKRGIGDNAIKLIEENGAKGISLMRKSTQPLNGICELDTSVHGNTTNSYTSIVSVCRMLVSSKFEAKSKINYKLHNKSINSIKAFLDFLDDLKQFTKNKISVSEIINLIVRKMNMNLDNQNEIIVKQSKNKKLLQSNLVDNINSNTEDSEKVKSRKLGVLSSISTLLKYSEPYTPNDEQPTGYECLLCFLQDASNGLLQMKKGEKISLSTIHRAKGLEWKVVFIPKFVDKVFPLYRESENSEIKNEFDEITIEEERRIAYVAFTRAKERLFISVPLNVGKPSPFIQDANLSSYKNRNSKERELIKQFPRTVTGKNWKKS
ncbi:UvrD/REP helicase N-terminal domain protein [Cryptosporidium meleagridis]|uniref:DNA 3'-5' helicase n=1 Tax=Cryptosporidium meleagridis TaxID=93969 RepID=A0A2P4Z4A7_9CRYT|nr:UvrD/REP helicase N-terminal domain protein [Cryptosporidium meleagridis]